MSKLLTISIAAYNMEKYIEQTLDSLIDERIIDDLEIFVVDDGGSDRTLEIAKEYAERYPNSIIPVHKENGGYGTTVNYSLAHATGKYFKLLDGDDWFDKDGLYKTINALKAIEADVIMTRYKRCYDENDTEIVYVDGIETDRIINICDLEIKNCFSMWGIAYKTEIIRKSGLELPAKMLYTDQLYAAIPFAIAQTMYYIDTCLYCYRLGREGQSVSNASRIKHFDENLYICDQLCEFYEEQKENGCKNINVLKLRAAMTYATQFKTYLLLPVSHNSLKSLKDYEHKIRQLSYDVYLCAEKCGKAGKLLRWFRKTNYIIYYPLKPLLDLTILKKGF